MSIIIASYLVISPGMLLARARDARLSASGAMAAPMAKISFARPCLIEKEPHG